MSAKNWKECPACRASRLADQKEKIAIVRASYGKVSQDVYLANMEKTKRPITGVEETMREDYEFHVDGDGVFTMVYSCYCEKCNFQYTHNHEEVTSMKEETKRDGSE